jgi:UDP-glucose 4-epimerase
LKAFVTGGAGFIGSNLVDRLLARGDEVVAYDNLTTGRREFLTNALENPRFKLVEGDVLDARALGAAMRGSDFVFHLAANADVRFGVEHPEKDLQQNTTATFRVLEAMRENGVKRIAFSSTGSIYGEPTVFPTPEDAPFPVQTSLYAASKLAGEGLIAAYAAGYGFTGLIFRFVSLLGERYTHGHVFDFYSALKRDPSHLRVLGDGRQQKSYLYVQDCVAAVLAAVRAHEADAATTNIYNLGTDETVTVDQSLRNILAHLGLSPRLEYEGGRRGWVGDSPLIQLDCTRIRSLGWEPTMSIVQATARTLDWFEAHPYIWQHVATTE